jgi:hypothetical protein
VLDLTVTVDHNVVDGAPATRFGAELPQAHRDRRRTATDPHHRAGPTLTDDNAHRPARSRRWRSARTARSWPAAAATARCCSGTQRAAGRSAPRSPVHGGFLTDLALGGQNYQIEHHLFPNMPRASLRHAQPIIRAQGQSLGLASTRPRCCSPTATVLRHLDALGAPLRTEKSHASPSTA